MRRNWRRK